MKILFRVDSSPEIGVGHLSRCKTLARALVKRGHEVLFLSTDHLSSYAADIQDIKVVKVPRLPGYRPPVLGLDKTWLGNELQREILFSSKVSEDFAPDFTVVDHYSLDHEWESAVRGVSGKLFVIDDLADRKHDCDHLLDQTLGRKKVDYQGLVPQSCKLALGPFFALLRNEFSEKKIDPATLTRVNKIFISMGGGDPRGVTLMVLRGLESISDKLELALTLDPNSPGFMEVGELIKSSHHHIRIISPQERIVDRMLEAHLAFGAGGTMAWERCAVGLPSWTITLARNQEKVINELLRHGAVRSLGPFERVTPKTITNELTEVMQNPSILRSMSSMASHICDGHGVIRVCAFFEKPMDSVWIRPALEEDIKIMFDWQIHPETRKFSLNKEVPTWEGHLNWSLASLKDPRRELCIMMDGSTPVGVFRLDVKGAQGKEVSILLDPELKGKGIGEKALRLARLFWPRDVHLAYIEDENVLSIQAFKKAGYEKKGEYYVSNPVEI